MSNTLVATRSRRTLIFSALWAAAVILSMPIFINSHNAEEGVGYWVYGGLYAYPLVLILFLLLDRCLLHNWEHPARNWTVMLGLSALLISTIYIWISLALTLVIWFTSLGRKYA